MNVSLISMSVRQMLIVVIILDHTLANASVVILAMAKFVIKVCVCVCVCVFIGSLSGGCLLQESYSLIS